MSAGQVVVGLLIAFFALLLSFKWCPFASDTLNTVNTLAQLNLFFFLLVRARARFRLPWVCGRVPDLPPAGHACPLPTLQCGLLLKVDIDGQGNNLFFSAIVSVLSLMPTVLPVLITIYMRVNRGGLEARMIVNDASFDG